MNRYISKITFVVLLVLPFFGLAQATFISSGKIEFEKKVNMHSMMGDNWWAEQMKDKLPQFRTTYFDLVFGNNQSLFTTGREVADDKYKNFWGSNLNDDIIYNNYDSSKTVSSKQVFEKNYLVQDSLVKIDWRITAETRTIAGFECHKAVGKFMDSLYVIAFFTEEITTPAGPGIFNGLPGLILGIGFPRMHYTMYATKLELVDEKTLKMKAPAKGKKTNRRDMFATVKEATKDWGKEANKEFLEVVL